MSKQQQAEPIDFKLSATGASIAAGTGIGELMVDLGTAMAAADGGVHMLGGGNPAHIPEVEQVWQRRMGEISADPAILRRVLSTYDPPQGNARFIETLADYLRRQLGWPVSSKNIALTNGGQSAFFTLFSLLAGSDGNGQPRTILLPMMPEYIGYANQGLAADIFRGSMPQIVETGQHSFRYRVDFSSLPIDATTAAICVSRPCNPTGNVLSDAEVQHLSAIAEERKIPLIIDNAYGQPFPAILYKNAQSHWADHHIQVISLSKLGLPGTRTAAIIGPPSIIRAVASMTAVTSLANGNLGQAIIEPLLKDGTLATLCTSVIQPYYAGKLAFARKVIAETFPDGCDYALHESDGALFLWLWLRNCPISSMEFYQRLKSRNILVVPGEYFFYGINTDTATPDQIEHSQRCLRISFAMPEETVRAGLQGIAREMIDAYK